MFAKPENTRKFQCFCCGMLYKTLEEMKLHIIEKHDADRDYITCPVSWCEMPIRDLKNHFKIKHPTLPIPNAKLNKSIVWKDFGAKTGKRIRKPKFREGHFLSKKNNKEFYYRSGLECETLEILEQIDAILKYDVEPFEIDYYFEGKKHKYRPDLSILYDNHTVEIIEVKPSNQTDLEQNKAKWAAANAYCQVRNWEFTVLTEKGIGKLKKMLKNST